MLPILAVIRRLGRSWTAAGATLMHADGRGGGCPRQADGVAACIPGKRAWPLLRIRLSSRQRAGRGQSLVEFALTLGVFVLVTLGLFDGLRVIFYYSQVQEAAREGARWASIQVGRAVNNSSTQTPWGRFNTPGNVPTTYIGGAACSNAPSGNPPSYPSPASSIPSCYQLSPARTMASRPYTNTIVGAVTLATTAVDLSNPDTTISITTTIPLASVETGDRDPALTNAPITVTVNYPFRPILGMVFGGVTIPLRGSSSMLHE